MKYVWKAIWFIQALIARLIPMILFFAAHAVGEVYSYNWNPLQFLDLKNLPGMYGSYLFLYGALGLIILILFFMKLPIIARVMTVGILFSQLQFFLAQYDAYIYGNTDSNPYYRFYMSILFSVILGFVLQVMWRLILQGLRQGRYKLTMSAARRRQGKPVRKSTKKQNA